MMRREFHLSDAALLLFAEGETTGRDQDTAGRHLSGCEQCRLRMWELENAMAEAVRMHEASAPLLPPADGPRDLLKSRLRVPVTATPHAAKIAGNRYLRVAALCAASMVMLALLWPQKGKGEHLASPRYELTPGAVRTVAARDVCRAELSGNAGVTPALESLVFSEYGMPAAERRAYEVDYLITPALGGSDDIRNLWPQPYAGSPWNAYVKDALEDHLRGLVCSGKMELGLAQREIAVDWIAAYKKYFRTRRPLPEHTRSTHGE